MPRIPRSVSNIPVPVSEGGTNAITSAAAALSLNLEVGKIDMAVSSKVLTITCSTPCTRFIPSSTSGINTLIDISGKSWSFNFDTSYNAASCGITPTVSWIYPMPWFAYLLNGTDTAAGIQAIVSRNPCMNVSPAEALFHYSDAAADTDSQLSVIVPYADGTDYSAKPVLPIGSYRMTYDTADDDWTPSALSNTDGYGKFQEGVAFTYPAGQNGNLTLTTPAVATYLFATGGDGKNDVPTWATNQGRYIYTITRTGLVTCSFDTESGSGDCTNGDLNISLRSFCPYKAARGTTYVKSGIGFIKANNTGGYGGVRMDALHSDGYVAFLYNNSSVGANANVYASANDEISIEFSYQAF